MTLCIASGLLAQPLPAPDSQDVDATVSRLRQVTGDLSETVRRFEAHLDEAVSRFDRGYHSAEGVRVPGADADLTSPADVVQTAVRKSMAFRMLASRSDKYQPAALDDLDRIQILIAETRKRTAEVTSLLRRLDVVSAGDINAHSLAEAKNRRDQLLRARGAAERAVGEAQSVLPIEAPEPEAPDRDGLGGFGADGFSAHSQTVKSPLTITNSAPTVAPPIRIEHRKRVTLVKENWCRVALTDSGVTDETGRHIFYQEEWIQRGDVVIRKRWRVGVDTATGQHVLVRRYPSIELAGFLADVYGTIDRTDLWYIEPPAGATKPSRDELDRALTEVAASRRAIDDAAAGFSRTIRELMTNQDQQRIATDQIPIDAGLPESLRGALFAIRAQLGGVPAVLDAERRVRQAIERGGRSVDALESMAAWANRISGSAEWDQILRQSDGEIDRLRAAEKTAISRLPPDMARPEAEFPALAKNTIVRIRRLPSSDSRDGVRCLQEVWMMETPIPGDIRVRRTAVLVILDPKTGDQNLAAVKTTYYQASTGEALEEIFDENAADDILLNARS